MMMITFNPSATYRPTIENGQITMRRSTTESKDKGSDNKANQAEAKENGQDFKTALAEVYEDNQTLNSDFGDAKQTDLQNRETSQNNMKGIQELSNSQNTATGNTTAVVESESGDSGSIKQLFSKLFSGTEEGDNMLSKFSGVAAQITGQSETTVKGIMDTAGALFKGGADGYTKAASFIGTALGLNDKAMALIGTIASLIPLLSNPFSAAGAAAAIAKFTTQVKSLMGESKSENKKASTARTNAINQQKVAQEKVKLAQKIQQDTAALQEKIKVTMEKIKDSKKITEKEMKELLQAKETLTKLNTPKNTNTTIAQNKVIPPQQQLALAQPVVPSNPTITPPPVPTTPPSSSIVAFTPPAFTGKF